MLSRWDKRGSRSSRGVSGCHGAGAVRSQTWWIGSNARRHLSAVSAIKPDRLVLIGPFSPHPHIRHRRPGLCDRQRLPVLQQLDRDPVRRAHERHPPVPRRPVDRHAVVHQALAGGVDIVDRVGEVPEVAPAGVGLGVPVVGEFDLRRLVARRGQEDQREAPLRHVAPGEHLQPEGVAVEVQRGIDIGDADHGVEVMHALIVP